MKTWQVGPYTEDWVVIVHADSRSQARVKGASVNFDDFIEMRAIRLPNLDGKFITAENLIDAGFSEEYEGIPIDAIGYILDCGCEICKQSIRMRV